MPRQAQNSSCRDPENRSEKFCACGNHSRKARKKRLPWKDGHVREQIRAGVVDGLAPLREVAAAIEQTALRAIELGKRLRKTR